jgi:predicted ATPase
MIPFVGRPREQARLLEHWERALAGSSQQVLLRGEAGIGKTRLVDELSARVRAQGGRVLRGRCWDLGDAPAYWPWSQALGAYLDERGAEAVAPLVADLDPAVVRLMPRLRPAVRVPDPHDDGSAAAQLRLFEALTVLLRRLGADRPTLLVLDDLEAADEPSLLLLRYLARMGRLGSLLLLAVYRTPVPPAAPSAAVLDHLANDPGVELLELGGLESSELGLLMKAMTGEPVQAPVLEAVHARTGGNPLFASEFIRLLVASPSGAAAPLSWSPLPSGVRG